MILFIASKWVGWAFHLDLSIEVINVIAFFSFAEVIIELGGFIAFVVAYFANKK